MSFKLRWLDDGEEDDEVFDTEEEAEDYAVQQVGNYHLGGEILNMSNPGDYPLDEDEDEDDPEYEIIEVDD